MSILASPGTLRVLANYRESGELRSLMQALAVQMDAYVIRSQGTSEVIMREQ